MDTFRDNVVIVTGASEGIGRALCLALAPEKPRLAIAARNVERLESLRQECEARGAEVLVIPTDVTAQDACKALIDRTVAQFGRIDTLINNAGRTMWTTFEQITDLSIFDQLMRLNYLGAVYCTHCALPYIRQSRGRIVGISSVAGLAGVPTRTGYSASKHAMFGFFNSLRVELLGSGVSITMVAPDFVLSEIHRRAFDGDGGALGQSPLHEDKIMTASECARLIVEAVRKRRRLLITSRRGKMGRWLAFLAPQLMDRVAARAIAQRK